MQKIKFLYPLPLLWCIYFVFPLVYVQIYSAPHKIVVLTKPHCLKLMLDIKAPRCSPQCAVIGWSAAHTDAAFGGGIAGRIWRQSINRIGMMEHSKTSVWNGKSWKKQRAWCRLQSSNDKVDKKRVSRNQMEDLHCLAWEVEKLAVKEFLGERWRTYGTRAQSGTRDDFAWHAPYSWDKRNFF